MKLSLVIPCYNESANLPLLLNRFEKFENSDKDIEIVIVDNGSTDNTQTVLDKFVPKFSFIKCKIYQSFFFIIDLTISNSSLSFISKDLFFVIR